MDGRSGVVLVVGGAGYVGSVLMSELLERVIGFEAHIPVEDTAKHMVRKIRAHDLTDFDNSRYYNICWSRCCKRPEMLSESREMCLSLPPPQKDFCRS
jgi:hypothetical protein